MKTLPSLLIVLFALLFAAPTLAEPAALYYVDRDDDADFLNCTSAANDCTLRSAIRLANGSAATDSIGFLGDRTITLSSDLPSITGDNLTIFAFNQTVKVDAAGLDNIFVVRADNITLSGLILFGGNNINSNGRLIVVESNVQNININGNLIGDDVGSADCGTYFGGYDGIYAISSTTIHIYGNTFRCLRGAGVRARLGATNVFIGENTSGTADSAQANSFSQSQNGVVIETDNNRVHNSTFEDHSNDGIILSGSNNAIYDNLVDSSGAVGIDVSGSNNDIYANVVQNSATDGIAVSSGGGNVIGCSADPPYGAARRNIVVNNAGNGVHLSNVGSLNLIACNYIGVEADGTTAGENRIGIRLFRGSGAFIGNSSVTGSVAEMGNVISGNQLNGILLDDSDSNLIAGNIIGAAANGTSNLGNGTAGIQVVAGSASNLIGEDTANSRNSILFNGGDGILFSDGGSGNEVQRNDIGRLATRNTTRTATATHNNALSGISVIRTNGVHIGDATDCNLSEFCLEITNHAQYGIYIDDSDGVIVGNRTYIYGNDQPGIYLVNGANDAEIYGWVTSNGNGGIVVAGATTTGNLLQLRRVRDNSGLPIDLGFDGATSNDVGDGDSGANTLLNFPEVTVISGTTVEGTACNNCLVDVFDAFGDPRGNGGGGEYVGTISADASGAWSVDLGTYGLTPTDAAFTARDAANNTSEMSPVASLPTAIQLTLLAAQSSNHVPLFLFLMLTFTLITLYRRKRNT